MQIYKIICVYHVRLLAVLVQAKLFALVAYKTITYIINNVFNNVQIIFMLILLYNNANLVLIHVINNFFLNIIFNKNKLKFLLNLIG